MDAMNVMLSVLELVYPPVSNQEAEWVRTDPEVKRLIRSSNLYAIGIRPELTFDELRYDASDGASITLSLGEQLTDEVHLNLRELAANVLDYEPEDLVLDVGPKVIRLYAGTDEEVEAGLADLFEWFTTEKVLYDRSRGLPGLSGLDRYRDFSTYELLYVGIAKTTDTFDRLFAGAHEARQRILTNEWPLRQGSRTTDEMVLFPLRVAPTTFRTIASAEELQPMDPHYFSSYLQRVVADAEKALVHLLDPRYNVEKYARYPISTDGLWGEGHQRYGFLLAENILFTTGRHVLRGSWDTRTRMFDDRADLIVVSGEQVELLLGTEG